MKEAKMHLARIAAVTLVLFASSAYAIVLYDIGVPDIMGPFRLSLIAGIAVLGAVLIDPDPYAEGLTFSTAIFRLIWIAGAAYALVNFRPDPEAAQAVPAGIGVVIIASITRFIPLLRPIEKYWR